MSALQFLNKKSWHTATRRNNEKLWLREQEAAKEQARIDELQKQLTEERRQEELHRLEEDAGRLDPSAALKRRRLNWMYEYGRDSDNAPPAPAGEAGNTVADDAMTRRERKEREDVMLGRKPLNIEKMGDQEREQRAAFVDVEAKMREDPLVQIELERARLRAAAGIPRTVSAGSHVDGNHGAAESPQSVPQAQSHERTIESVRRKEERQLIRRDRQRRREQRALCKPAHVETSGIDTDANGPHDDQLKVTPTEKPNFKHVNNEDGASEGDGCDDDSRSHHSHDGDSLNRLRRRHSRSERDDRRHSHSDDQRHRRGERYDRDKHDDCYDGRRRRRSSGRRSDYESSRYHQDRRRSDSNNDDYYDKHRRKPRRDVQRRDERQDC